MALVIRRLEQADSVAMFDCSDKSLTDYLRLYAWQNQQRHSVGVTYVAVDTEAPRAVIGYYTLAASGISKSAFPEALARRVSPYREVPVILLARLAVDRRFQKRGIGEVLLAHALNQAAKVREQAGCRGVIVDAYPSAVPWYARFGFVPLLEEGGQDHRKMFLDLRVVEKSRG